MWIISTPYPKTRRKVIVILIMWIRSPSRTKVYLEFLTVRRKRNKEEVKRRITKKSI
jgi:hypothetical protein